MYCDKDACNVNKYEQTISRSYFPSVATAEYIANEFNTNTTELRKNYLLLNMFFDDMTVLNVIETQEFKAEDLIIYIGKFDLIFRHVVFKLF